jgi:hypothetical protein
MVRILYGSKNKKVIGRSRNLHSKEPLSLSSSAYIFIVTIKEVEKGKITYLGEREMCAKF